MKTVFVALAILFYCLTWLQDYSQNYECHEKGGDKVLNGICYKVTEVK